jgi:hypothetical protein
VIAMVRRLLRWLNPPCVWCTELGHDCFVCRERSERKRTPHDQHNPEKHGT